MPMIQKPLLNSETNEMTTTRSELLDILKQVEEVTLMELLEITSEDIVNRFEDFIELKYDKLNEEYGNYE